MPNAARIRLLDPDELLGRLAASVDALGTGAVDLPERQRTLRATVQWSVGLLGDAERARRRPGRSGVLRCLRAHPMGGGSHRPGQAANVPIGPELPGTLGRNCSLAARCGDGADIGLRPCL